MRRPQQHGGACRMRQCEVRGRTVRKNDFLHERRKVDVVLSEVLDMPFEAVSQSMIGLALPTPIERRDRKPTRA